MEPILGQICIFGFNFAPKGWLPCNGQLLSIAQNQALFSLLGTTYGGDGRTTFALPNLQSRVPVHYGQGPGLSNYELGQTGGTENVTLGLNNMPAHTHTVSVPTVDSTADSDEPNGAILGAGTSVYSSANTANGSYGGVTASLAGNSQPFNNLTPYLALNFCIAYQGVFPPRP